MKKLSIYSFILNYRDVGENVQGDLKGDLNKWNQGIIIEIFQNLSNVILGTFSYNN